MKNIKCIIGATILTPICVSVLFILIITFGLCLDWLFNACTWIPWILIIFIISGFLLITWGILFEHCINKNRS